MGPSILNEAIRRLYRRASSQLAAVEIAIRLVQPAAPFHRPVAVGVAQALDFEQRVPRLDAEQLGARRIRIARLELLLGAHHTRAELRLEQVVERALVLGDRGRTESLEQAARKPHFLEHHRVIAEDQQALEHDHAVARLELQRARQLGAGASAPEVEQPALRRNRFAAVGSQTQETEAHLAFAVRGDEGSLALAPHQQVLRGELVDRFAHGALADAKARRKLDLTRNCVAGSPLPAAQPIEKQLLDLPVKGAELGRTHGALLEHSWPTSSIFCLISYK